MIILLTAFGVGLATCWFALEGLRQRVRRLEQALGDRLDSSAPQSAAAGRPENLSRPTIESESSTSGKAKIIEPEPGSKRSDLSVLIGPLIGKDEWEEVIGGSWLNKLGVLVFVIGVALLLRHSFGHMGAAGKISIGLATSILMLIGGAAFERKHDYPVYYGRGLIGGGWAALYFTTYAAHGISAARIIQSPMLATLLLIGVASAMIVHSIRYRSEVVTGLAYFVAFATLAITPMTEFAVIASVPLAISLLFVAQRFEWKGMAVVGLVSTYSAYVFSVARIVPSSSAFTVDQSVLTIYWLMFEAFDLFDLAKNKGSLAEESLLPVALFPLNACGYIGTSLLRWDVSTPIYMFLGCSALLFLGDSLVRAWLRPSPSMRDRELTLSGAVRGYEASLAATAVLAAAAILERFGGLRLNVVLIVEAEMLILAGLQLGLTFPTVLGSLIMLLPICRLLLIDFSDSQTIVLANFVVGKWSCIALLSAGTLYLDRWLVKYRWRVLFGYAAAVLLFLVIAVEIATAYVGLAWILIGIGLFQAGLAVPALDLRLQGYCAIALGVLSLLLLTVLNVPGIFLNVPEISGLALCVSALGMYSVAVQISRLSAPVISEAERDLVRRAALAAGAALAVALLWCELPMPMVAVGWSLFGLALMAVGTRWSQQDLRLQSYAVAVLAFARCWQVNFEITAIRYGVPEGIVTSALVIASTYASSQIQQRGSRVCVEARRTDVRRALDWLDARGRAIFGGLAIVLLTSLLYHRVEASALTEAWALEGVPLLIGGFVQRDRLLRVSGLTLLGACVLKVFFYDLSNLETVARIFSFIVLGLLLLGASLMYARYYERLKPYLSGDMGVRDGEKEQSH